MYDAPTQTTEHVRHEPKGQDDSHQLKADLLSYKAFEFANKFILRNLTLSMADIVSTYFS